MAHTLLFVDDEENILRALRRLFHRSGHEIHLAQSGDEALGILRATPISLIISDQRMPGMTGAELLQSALEIQPEAVRIMLTGYSDLEAAMQAINEGQVYRFLPKPWDENALLEVVAEALGELDLRREHADLQKKVREQNVELRELNETLERRVKERTNELEMALLLADDTNQNLLSSNLANVKAFAGLLDLRNQKLGAHCRRVAGLVPGVCARLGVEDPQAVQDMQVAALLHDIGKIALCEEILRKDSAELNGAERAQVKMHPVVGQGQIQVLEGLAGVAQMVRHHHEHLDGSGHPDGLMGEEIPLGARVIHVLDAYDHLTKGGARKGVEEKFALEALNRHVSRRFDPDVFAAVIQSLRDEADARGPNREVQIPLEELREGMVLTRDLRTDSGLLLAPTEESLTPPHIEKIKNFAAHYPTESHAFVLREQ